MSEEVKPLGEKGPTQEWINDVKSKYGDIYYVYFDDEPVVFRTITRKEYIEIMQSSIPTPDNPGDDIGESENRLVDMCTLWPENYKAAEEKKGGRVSGIAQYVLYYSGFNFQDIMPQKL
mgnify:CR=1 FL=1